MTRPNLKSDARLVTLALLVVVAGCGGGEPAAPAASAPTISAHPQSVTVDQGSAAAFAVTAGGTEPLEYQWRRNGASIAGATATSYTLDAVAGTDDGAQFTVVVSNAAGTVTSNPATLMVRTPPAITVQPASRTVLSGVPAVFSVTASGTALTYQWRRNGVDIPGATASAYAVGVPLAGDHGATYTVVVANALGNATSSGATLGVDLTPQVRPTSYANHKAFDHGARALPYSGQELARGFGDFFGAGNRDLVIARMIYDWNLPEEEAEQGPLEFHRWDGDSYVHEPAKVDGPTGCIHPRKAVVADFNADATPDVFVACHGYDKPPFPGERNVVALSQPGGVYHVAHVGGVGFFHSATAFDVDNDGDVDVVATNSSAANALQTYVNDGAGNFTVNSALFPLGGGPYFTVEAADVNNDGRADVLVGGHDWEAAPTLVLINDGSGTFAGVTPTTIPAIANEGVVLDFVVLDNDRDGVNEIYVLRTSGGDGTFYQSRTVQKVTWPALVSTVLHSERAADAPIPWVPFLLPHWTGTQYQVDADRVDLDFTLLLP